MDTKYFEEYQRQFAEWQKKFFETWLETLPNGVNGFKTPETWDKSLEFQKDLVENYLKAQKTATELALETQKKFWEGYFEMMQKIPVPSVHKAA